MTYRGELQTEEVPTRYAKEKQREETRSKDRGCDKNRMPEIDTYDREVVPRRRVAHIAHGGLAGVSLVSSMILHYHSLFTRYSEHDVPEIIRKSIHYLLERGIYHPSFLPLSTLLFPSPSPSPSMLSPCTSLLHLFLSPSFLSFCVTLRPLPSLTTSNNSNGRPRPPPAHLRPAKNSTDQKVFRFGQL